MGKLVMLTLPFVYLWFLWNLLKIGNAILLYRASKDSNHQHTSRVYPHAIEISKIL